MEFMMAFIIAAAAAIPITIALGLIYFFLAALVVNAFKLNYGERPIGFQILNAAVGATILTYFLIFALSLRKFLS